MNERIRELYVKALANAEGEEDMVDTLAELLIKECAHLCVVVAEETEAAQPNKGYEESAHTCYERIKEHFGVKR